MIIQITTAISAKTVTTGMERLLISLAEKHNGIHLLFVNNHVNRTKTLGHEGDFRGGTKSFVIS